MNKEQKRAIRLKITELLNSDNPNYEEIQRLSKLLGEQPKKEKPVLVGDKVAIHTRVYTVEPKIYLEFKNEGYTRSEIAEYYNLTINELDSEIKSLKYFGLLPKNTGIIGKNLANRLPAKRYYELKKEGKTEYEISNMYDISFQTLIQYKKEHGIKLDVRGRPPKKDIVHKNDFIQLKNKGLALWQISKILKVSRSTLFKLRKEWELL